MKLSAIYSRSFLIIRVGLALVFLANSYTAFVSPDKFIELLNKSFLAAFLPISPDWFVKFIGISDGVVSTLLLLKIGLKYVAIYAMLWIMGAMSVIGLKETGDFLEHFGPFAMALYIAINSMPKGRNHK